MMKPKRYLLAVTDRQINSPGLEKMPSKVYGGGRRVMRGYLAVIISRVTMTTISAKRIWYHKRP